MGKLKFVLISAGIFLVAFVVVPGALLSIFSSVDFSDAQSTQTTSYRLFTSLMSPIELLPVRADIGTEWKMMDAQSYSSTDVCAGFKSGWSKKYLKNIDSFGAADRITVKISKFGHPTNAEQCYSRFVDETIEDGGYKEWKTNNTCDESYGTKSDSGFKSSYSIRCLHDIFYINIQASGYDYGLSSDTKQFLKSINTRLATPPTSVHSSLDGPVNMMEITP